MRVCSSLYLLTRAHCARCSPSIPLWLALYLFALSDLLEEGLLLLPSPLGTPRPCLSIIEILKYIRSAEPHWLRHHPVACPKIDSRRKTVDWGCTMPLDFSWMVLSSLLQILRSSSHRHSVLMILFLSSMTTLSLLFVLRAACMLSYRGLQMEWCSCAACTVDVTVCFSRQTVSAPGASHAMLCSRQLLNLLIAFCLFCSGKWLLAYFLPPPSTIVSFAAVGFFLKYREDTDDTPMSPFDKNKPPCQATNDFTD